MWCSLLRFLRTGPFFWVCLRWRCRVGNCFTIVSEWSFQRVLRPVSIHFMPVLLWLSLDLEVGTAFRIRKSVRLLQTDLVNCDHHRIVVVAKIRIFFSISLVLLLLSIWFCRVYFMYAATTVCLDAKENSSRSNHQRVDIGAVFSGQPTFYREIVRTTNLGTKFKKFSITPCARHK